MEKFYYKTVPPFMNKKESKKLYHEPTGLCCLLILGIAKFLGFQIQKQKDIIQSLPLTRMEVTKLFM